MRDKILFFTDTWFFNFAAAKHMQEKYDADFYAIIDVDDKAKKFFQEQNIVHYQKVWFYLDNIELSNKKIDIEFLKHIEKKYNVNLWNIIYTDRTFYRKYYSYYKFRDSDILSLLEQECRFFDMVLEEIKPDFLSIFLTSQHHQELLYQMCKGIGIKILMLSPVRFGQRMMITEDFSKIDDIGENISNHINSLEDLEKYLKSYNSSSNAKEWELQNFELHKRYRYMTILRSLLSKRSPNYKKRYTNYGRTRIRIIREKIMNFWKKKYRSYFINENFLTKIDDKTPFIYFPLQSEPERVILMSGRFYDNQAAVISNISKTIPVGYMLYVKEHPSQKPVGWRSISFYKQIMELYNVRLIHPSISSEEMIKKCSLVITIAGTTGQEAAFLGKPVISFSDQIYCMLPSVFRVKSYEDLSCTIPQLLNKAVNPSDLIKFVNFIERNSFHFNMVGISSDFAYRFGFKGPIIDGVLPLEKVEKFLDDYKSDFDLLAIEHIKRIQYYKKLSYGVD